MPSVITTAKNKLPTVSRTKNLHYLRLLAMKSEASLSQTNTNQLPAVAEFSSPLNVPSDSKIERYIKQTQWHTDVVRSIHFYDPTEAVCVCVYCLRSRYRYQRSTVTYQKICWRENWLVFLIFAVITKREANLLYVSNKAVKYNKNILAP